MCVHSYLPPHTLESQIRDTNGFCAIQGSFLIFFDFPKNASFKSYGVICLPQAAPGVVALFPPRNKLICWFEAYSYVFTAQTTGLWTTACDSLAQTRETAQISVADPGFLKGGGARSAPQNLAPPTFYILMVYKLSSMLHQHFLRLRVLVAS